MSISKLGLELLEHYEGCKLEAYQDQGGVWTIGIGTTRYPFGKKVQKGDTLESREQAIALMEHDLKMFEVVVAKLVNVPLDQNEFDALVVFAYNCGTGEFGLGGSTLLKRINAGAPMDQIEEAWLRFRKSTLDRDGKDNDEDGIIDEPGEKGDNKGLINRRKSEFHLYKNGVNKFFNQ